MGGMIYDADGAEVAALPYRKSKDNPNIVNANAKLIAAAPDMLDALHAAMNWFTPPNDSKPFPGKQIADAIIKAQGDMTDKEWEVAMRASNHPWVQDWDIPPANFDAGDEPSDVAALDPTRPGKGFPFCDKCGQPATKRSRALSTSSITTFAESIRACE